MFKCPECGYLGFESEKKCPKCGTEVIHVDSGEETNSLMTPPEGVKEEEKTLLIESPHQIENRIAEDSLKIEKITERALQEIEPPPQSNADGSPEPSITESKVPSEFFSHEFDFKFSKKPQQQELPMTHKRVGEQKEIVFYPSIMLRASAFIIDSLLITGITSIFLLLPLLMGARNIFSLTELWRVILLPFYFLFIIFHLLYYTYFLTITGQTPGKAVVNLKVVGKGGLQLDWHEALLRAIGYILSSIPLGMGFFWAFFDKNRETWHDKLAGSKVVSVPR